MKAFQLCSICGHIIPVDKLKEHYATRQLHKLHEVKERNLVIKRFVDGDCNEPLTKK